MIRPLLATSLVVAASAAAYAAVATAPTILPTEWRLSAPPGTVVPTKTFPESAIPTADGRFLVVVEFGAGTPGIRILDARTLATVRDIAIANVYGVPLADRTGSGFWVGTAADDTLVHLDAATGTLTQTIALPRGFWPAGIARSPDGATLAVSGDLADAIVLVDPETGVVRTPIRVSLPERADALVEHDVRNNPASGVVTTGSHPAGIAFAPDGRAVFVARWAASSIAVVDPGTRSLVGTIPVGRHPEFLASSTDGTRLFVSEPDDDAIGTIDLASRTRIADVNVAPYDGRFFGGSPTQLAVAPDGKRLYATLSAANAVAVLAIDGTMPKYLGAFPTGWYPTALAFAPGGLALDVVDGMGEGATANPQFKPFTSHRGNDQSGYVATNRIGSVRRIALPTDAELAATTSTVHGNEGPELADPPAAERGVVRAGGPLKHVIYIIKENRTYDQVLGDLTGADGDPSLALFDARVTPNLHAIARRFGILDNTYADAEVSADGHNWSTAAFGNDYLEHMWPEVYGGRRKLYDFEDGAVAATPHAGYIWNDAARHGVTMRNYGEFVSDPDTLGIVRSHMTDLADVTDPHFVGFDLTYSDLDREKEWAREFDAYAASGTLPQLEIMRLPNDHTSGTKPGALTPTSYNVQNDLAVGRLVEHLSHSRYWRDTAVFVVEDDAQDGPDHVSDQRMDSFVASSYAAGGVLHEHHSTAGIVRTIEIILGLPPMSSYDAAARPLFDAFRAAPDARPYDALPETVSMTEKNAASSYGAKRSAELDFRHEDAVPDATLNDLLWHAVRGARATPPPYGRFPQSAAASTARRERVGAAD